MTGRRAPRGWALPVGLACLAAASVALAARPSLMGAPAPDFTLTTLAGKPLSLSSLKGKAVVLDFFASWCGPCRDELPSLVALEKRYRGQGVQVVGISLDDSAEPVRKLVREFQVPYPVALGDEKLAERYGGILGLPVVFVIDREGRVVGRHEGETSVTAAEADLKKLLALTK